MTFSPFRRWHEYRGLEIDPYKARLSFGRCLLIVTKPSIPHRNSIAEFFNVFDTRPRDIVYVQPYGYRTARWTYGRFAETAAQFARELDSRGVAAGDRVVIWGPNSAEWAAAFWGCILHGAVVVPMDWIATDDFARRVVDQVQAKLLVVAKENPLP